MKISDIIFKEEYILSTVDGSAEFDNIVTDPRKTAESSLLIIPNSKKYSDGIKFGKPPVAIICDDDCPLPENTPFIRVKNSRITTANAYFRFEDIAKERMTLIGITGTNGKSSTAMLIKEILTGCGHKVGYIGTGKIEIGDKIINDSHYSMTTPDPEILYKSIKQMQTEGCDTVVMEVSSHSLALEKVAPLFFDYAVFTNFSNDHIDFHGSSEEYFNAKMKLFEKASCCVFNTDDKKVRLAYGKCKSRKLSAGIIWKGDVWASNIENHGLDGISYLYHGGGFSFKTNLKLAGSYNAYNSLLAATVCIDMGCKPCDVKSILNEINTLPGRFEIINDTISVIIDYAHTDSAFESIMKDLSVLKKGRKLTVVFGCGGNRDKEKRPKMATIAERYANRVIVTSDNSRNENVKDIISDIIRGFTKGKYEVIENRRDAIRAALLCADDRDLVAIIGKGPEKYNIDNNGYRDFDEKAIVLSVLAERKVVR